MEEFFQGVGIFIFVVMALIGLAAGWIAATITGGGKGRYMLLGLIGAVTLPVLLAVLGVGVLAAGGVLAVLFAALIGAAVLVVIGKMIFD